MATNRFISEELAEALRADHLYDEEEWDDDDVIDLRHRSWEFNTARERDSARVALAYLLGFRRAHEVDNELLDQLLDDLEQVLVGGSDLMDRSATKRMADLAVADLHWVTVLELLRAGRWDNFSLPQGCKLKNLSKHTRPELARRLADTLYEMLLRWQKHGLLDLKHRRKRTPSSSGPRPARSSMDPKEREARRSGFTPTFGYGK